MPSPVSLKHWLKFAKSKFLTEILMQKFIKCVHFFYEFNIFMYNIKF